MIRQTSTIRNKLPNMGDIIFYKLRSSDRPIHPDRKWKGKVIMASQDTSRSNACLTVESLEDGYEELTELVYLSQVVEIATQEDKTPCS